MSIINNFSHAIIEDDDRDAYVSFQHHKDRGSLGGVDLAYPYGTPIKAPADGKGSTVEWNGSGGHTYKLITVLGTIEFMHLSSFGKTGDIKTGDIIGWSGGSAYGNLLYYDAHLHVHIVVNGVRLNLWDFFESQFNEEEDMRKISVGSKLYFIGSKGIILIQNTVHLGLINRVMERRQTDFNEAELDMLKLYM